MAFILEYILDVSNILKVINREYYMALSVSHLVTPISSRELYLEG
jgi:hypothetical protein